MVKGNRRISIFINYTLRKKGEQRKEKKIHTKERREKSNTRIQVRERTRRGQLPIKVVRFFGISFQIKFPHQIYGLNFLHPRKHRKKKVGRVNRF